MVLICLPPVSKTAESQSKPVPCPQLQQLTFQFRTSRSVKCHVVKFESPIDSHHRLEFDAPVEDHRSSPKAKSGCDSTIVHYQLAMLCCHKSPSQNNKTSPNFYGDSIAKNPFQTIFFCCKTIARPMCSRWCQGHLEPAMILMPGKWGKKCIFHWKGCTFSLMLCQKSHKIS